MSIGYVCKPEQQLVIAVWDGTINLAQWRDHLRRMFADPDYALVKYQLTDLRFSEIDSSVKGLDIKRVVNFMATQPDKIAGKKIAIVAGNEWERPKQAESLLEAVSVHPIVFTDLVTACLWLGADVVEIGNIIKEIRLKLRGNS